MRRARREEVVSLEWGELADGRNWPVTETKQGSTRRVVSGALNPESRLLSLVCKRNRIAAAEQVCEMWAITAREVFFPGR